MEIITGRVRVIIFRTLQIPNPQMPLHLHIGQFFAVFNQRPVSGILALHRFLQHIIRQFIGILLHGFQGKADYLVLPHMGQIFFSRIHNL